MSEGSRTERRIYLGDEFGDVVVIANGAQVAIGADGSLHGIPAAANDGAKSKAVLQIGDIESDGDHKGEIYGGNYPADNKPIWFSAAPRLMDHFAAAAWASGQGGSLPTRKQGDYLTTLKPLNESAEVLKISGGAFNELFNRGDSFPARVV